MIKDTDVMQFGKYKGVFIGKVPGGYLLWLVTWVERKKSPYIQALKQYVADNYERLEAERKEAEAEYFKPKVNPNKTYGLIPK